jgi:hypothetical protein
MNTRLKEELVKSNQPIPGKLHLDSFIPKFEENLKVHILGAFNEIGLSAQNVTFDNFSKFMEIDHTLEIMYCNKRIRIAMSLNCLNDIGLISDI